MTTELEQEFFKVFGVARKHLLNVNTNQFVDVYPEITDRKLLEMICILVKTQTSYPINKSSIKNIKDEVLQRCVNLKSYIKHQIQQLFKEEE